MKKTDLPIVRKAESIVTGHVMVEKRWKSEVEMPCFFLVAVAMSTEAGMTSVVASKW